MPINTWHIVANGYPGRIEFEAAGSRLSGRLWLDIHNKWETLQDVSFDGRTLRFLRPISSLNQRYTGVVKGGEISGTFDQAGRGVYKWKMWRGNQDASNDSNDQRLAELLQQGYEQEKKGNLEEAVDRYQASLKIKDDGVVKGRIEKLKLQIEEMKDKEAIRGRFEQLLKDGYERERRGDLEGALSRYTEASRLSPDAEVAKRIKLLEDKLRAGAADEKREEQFTKLIKQGYGKEQAGDLEGAVKDYKSALAIRKDDKVSQRVDQLQRALEKQAGNRSTAITSRNEKAERKQSPEPDPPSRKPHAPWSGTYETKDATADGHTETFLTLRLVQSGNELTGQVTLKIFTQGNLYSDDTVSLNGSCNGTKAVIHAEGESVSMVLSSDGNRISASDGVEYKRVR